VDLGRSLIAEAAPSKEPMIGTTGLIMRVTIDITGALWLPVLS
jgi:hypothetical protein